MYLYLSSISIVQGELSVQTIFQYLSFNSAITMVLFHFLASIFGFGIFKNTFNALSGFISI